MNELTPNESEFVLYTAPTGEVKLEVLLLDESIWLTQKAIGELFGKSKSTISEHFKNIFTEGELQEELVVRKFRTTTQHGAIAGKTQGNLVNFYNLDAIIS
ncbi:MAG: cell filamentation protein Fic, partial [Crocinitomicaceae bacterium]|nr:cell filamentation protein Fic [Crocinitomicaceae bacterium]